MLRLGQRAAIRGGQFVTLGGQFATLGGQFVTISGQFVTLGGQFVTISGQFVTLGGQFVTLGHRGGGRGLHRTLRLADRGEHSADGSRPVLAHGALLQLLREGQTLVVGGPDDAGRVAAVGAVVGGGRRVARRLRRVV